MLLDMTQLLSGAVDRLDFSYTLSADRVPYEGACVPEDGENIDVQATNDSEEDEGMLPIVFDDVVVTAPVAANAALSSKLLFLSSDSNFINSSLLILSSYYLLYFNISKLYS